MPLIPYCLHTCLLLIGDANFLGKRFVFLSLLNLTRRRFVFRAVVMRSRIERTTGFATASDPSALRYYALRRDSVDSLLAFSAAPLPSTLLALPPTLRAGIYT